MKINAVQAELHVFEGETNWAQPLRLQICFDDGTALRLRGSGDGAALVVDRLPLEPPMDMHEYGRTDIFDFTDRLDPALKGKAIGRPEAVRNSAKTQVGLALPLPDGERFCIWIDGDEFRWGQKAALDDDFWLDA